MARSAATNPASPTSTGGATSATTTGASDSRPTSAPATENTKPRTVITSPANVSRTISTWWVSRDTGLPSTGRTLCTARRSVPAATWRTRSSRNGSTTSARQRYTRRVPYAPTGTARASTASQPSPTAGRPARNPVSTARATA